MSLNLTIINSSGAWQCSDHRLIDPKDGRLVDDASAKHLILRCPDGAALLAYAGLGRVNGVTLSDWIREILRGESRTVDQSLILIREAATRDLGVIVKGRFRHMFSIAAFIQERPWMVQIRNFSLTKENLFTEPAGVFDTSVREAVNGFGGSFGPLDAVTADDQALLCKVSTKRPRSTSDFQNVLSGINRRTAARTASISPHCTTTYMPVKGEPFSTKFDDGTKGASAGPTIPLLLFGIDTTEMTRLLGESMRQMGNRGVLAEAESERAARDSVVPKNRLRR